MINGIMGVLESSRGSSTNYYALNLDPAFSDKITFDSSENLIGSRRTIELWFRPTANITSGSTDMALLASRNVVNKRVYIQFLSGKIDFFRDVGSSTTKRIKSNSASWTAGTWYHLAVVVDPSTGAKMYVDGVLQTETDSDTTDFLADNEDVTISSIQPNNIRYFDGAIYGLKVWSDARTAGEILTDMNTYYPNGTTDLKDDIPLTEGSGITATGVNGSVGTITTTNGGGSTYIDSLWELLP